jgi:ubiquinone/menaquinone biosynthesis C-methylase UbiE
MALSLDRQNGYRERYRQSHPTWRPATEAYEMLIRSLLRPDMRVLDVGCGRGGVLEQLGPAAEHPTGADPDFASLREHRLPALPRVQAMAENLPFQAGTFHVVLASWVFEHLENPQQTLAEFARVLKPGGFVVFITPNASSLITRLNQLLRPLQKTLVPRLYGRAEADTFSVHYRANRPHDLHHPQFAQHTLLFIADPSYLAFTPWLYRISLLLTRITPPVHLVGALQRLP